MSDNGYNRPTAINCLCRAAVLIAACLAGAQSWAQGLIPPTPNTSDPSAASSFKTEDENALEEDVVDDLFQEQVVVDAQASGHSTSTGKVDSGTAQTIQREVTTAAQSGLQRYGYSTPFRAQFFGGENYAEPSSFLSLEILRPLGNQLFSDRSEQIQYLDGRLGISTDGGGFLGNIGVGQRLYSASTDSIADVNLWYDVDSTSDRIFHQVAAGGQLQNDTLLFRGHYYLPIGDDEQFTGFSSLTGNTAFQGNNLALERFRMEEQAFKGFDLELGLILPWDTQTSRWYVGYYNFEADDADPIKGVSSTITFEPIPRLTVGLQVTVDEETSDAGYLFSASYDFYHGPRDPAPNIRHRLGESVRRNHHIVSRGSSIYDPVLAEDASGNLINFLHVSSTGTGGGTVESPYASLSQAATVAAGTPGSIIYAHADSVFSGQSIALPANTRFLGEGIDHMVTTASTQLGDVTLPRATTGTVLPTISGSLAAAPAITLASSTEVNGFRIQNALGTGIFGTGGTTDATILNTTVNGAATGVNLSQFSGSYAFSGLSIANTTGAGLLIDRSTPAGQVTFNDSVSISGTGTHGVHFDRNQDESEVTFSSTLAVANAGGNGIFFDDNGDSSKATFSGAVTVTNPGASGLLVSNLNTTGPNTTTDISLPAGLTVINPGADGLAINQDNSNVDIQSLAVTNWGRSAIAIDASSGTLNITDDLTFDNVSGSLESTIQIANSTGDFTFGNVTVTDTSRAGPGAPTVFLSANDTGINEITFGSLNVTANNGIALFGQDTGATVSTLVIGDGVISATGSTAVSLERLSTDISFQSVSASNAAVGISLNQIGQLNAFHRQFEIRGDGITGGSGGLLTNVQQGVVNDGGEDVILRLLNVNSSVAGVVSRANGTNQPENLTLDRLTLSGGTSANWVGIDVAWQNGAHFSDPNLITGNTIIGAGADQIGIRIVNNQSNPQMEATISGNAINLSGANTNGIVLSATGLLVGQTTNLGGINLTGGTNNSVNVTGTPFVSSEAVGATIDGQIFINGLLRP